MNFLVILAVVSSVLASAELDVKGRDLLSGQAVHLMPGAGGLVVAFLSAKCPCSASHVSELKALAKDFPQTRFVAVHANPDEDRESVRTYFDVAALGFPVIRDSKQELANRFRANRTPHVFVLNSTGAIVYRGGVSDSKTLTDARKLYLRAALNEMSAGQPIKESETRTLGCAIARGGKHDW